MKKRIQISEQYKELLRYLIIGGLTTIISIISFHLSNQFLSWTISNLISWFVAVTFAYFTNKCYVFRSTDTFCVFEILSFFGMRLCSLAMDMALMVLFIQIFYLSNTLSKILVQFAIVVLNYFFSKFIIFKRKRGESNYEQNQCDRTVLQ